MDDVSAFTAPTNNPRIIDAATPASDGTNKHTLLIDDMVCVQCTNWLLVYVRSGFVDPCCYIEAELRLVIDVG